MGYAWLKTNYAGSGPLKMREWRANEIVTLERNDNYYGPKCQAGTRDLPPREGSAPRSACCWKRATSTSPAT